MYFWRPYKNIDEIKTDEKTPPIVSESQNAAKVKLFDRKDTPRRAIRLLFAVWFAVYLAFEMVFMKYCVAYFQYSPLNVPVETGTQILSIGVTVYTVGQFNNHLAEKNQ